MSFAATGKLLLLHAIGSRLKLSEIDGAMLCIDWLLAAAIRGNNLERVLDDCDTVIVAMKRWPDQEVLQTGSMRQPQTSSQMKDDIHDLVFLAPYRHRCMHF